MQVPQSMHNFPRSMPIYEPTSQHNELTQDPAELMKVILVLTPISISNQIYFSISSLRV
jgi:hypothetical protein